MSDSFCTAPRASARLQAGPLGPHIVKFVASLSERGYAQSTIQGQLRLVSDLSHWLEDQGLDVMALAEEKTLEAFEGSPSRRTCIRRYQSVLEKLLEYLRSLGQIPPPKPPSDDSAIGGLLRDFRQHLETERGLTAATLINYLPWVQRFLDERFGAASLLLCDLHPTDVQQFVLRHAQETSPGWAKSMVSGLRSFLRFLRLRGDISTDLAAAVPTVANWHLATLPRSLEPKQVERLLNGCDRSDAMGRRDFAILLLLARLGLRAGEVVAMSLEDLDWKAGVVTIRGKGSQHDRLPIPQDVGEALATYLRHGRPQCSSRRVFIRARAPHRGFASCVAICSIVHRALAHVELSPPQKGAHLLRHTLATEMLRQGASMTEIGQILRHRYPSTTEIYAKVDRSALRELAQPWPGGEA